jgi:hypothetical protein
VSFCWIAKAIFQEIALATDHFRLPSCIDRQIRENTPHSDPSDFRDFRMRLSKFLFAMIVAFWLAVDARADEPKPNTKEFVPLFNGKNLEGWTPKIRLHDYGVNYADTFRVEEGLLKVRYDKYDKFDEQFGHIFYKEAFSHYILRVEYRFVGEQCKGGPGWAIRNSGAMLHCQDPKTMDKDQKFPVSIEGQLLGGDGRAERPTMNVCTPGTNIVMNGQLITKHCNTSKAKTYHGDQWVTVEFEVRGHGVVKHLVDGKVAMEYEKTQYDPNDSDAKKLIKDGNLKIESGFISMQSESHPIDFRKIEIKLLEKE